MNVDAMREVADLIEHNDRFSLLFFAAFIDAAGGQVYVEDRRVPTADEMLEGEITVKSERGSRYTIRTTGCISGWVNACYGHHDLEDWWHAASVLDLTITQARRLFFAQTDASLWRTAGGHTGWGKRGYRSIEAEHAAMMLRCIADGTVPLP